jgi:hypothetical protein
MRKFFTPNIDWRGRIARLVYGVVMIIAGLALLSRAWWVSLVLIIFGVFALYEAFRGWCVMRACGIKTKL